MNWDLKNMKLFKTLIIIVTLLTLITIVFAEAVIKEFRVNPGINKVNLLWKVSIETNVSGYNIQRGFSQNSLDDIHFLNSRPGAIAPGSVKEYSYEDKSIFKNAGRIFYYRIQVLDLQKKVITSSEIRQVSPQISGVRHTWGSIKAMFR